MRQTIKSLPKNAAVFMRRLVVSVIALSTLLSGAPVYAAVPTYVVEIELNTKFERSLERFLFDLFNTLQRREEDFTAAFELQKIEKAREDTAKLFQEVQEELQDFGQAFDIGAQGGTDERLTGTGLAGNGTNPLIINPVKGSRIINDPLEFLFGEPLLAARIAAACAFNYAIWDQQGDLIWDDGRIPAEIIDELHDGEPKSTYGDDTAESVLNLQRVKAKVLTALQYGDWPYFAGSSTTNPLQREEPVGIVDSISVLFNAESYTTVLPRCESSMKTLRLDTPITAAIKVIEGIGHASLAGSDPMGGELTTAAEKAKIIRNMLFLSTLQRNVVRTRDASWEELDEVYSSSIPTTADDVGARIQRLAGGVVQQFGKLRELQYLAGQGIRPENLYLTHLEDAVCPDGVPQRICDGNLGTYRIDLNTEYVVSPAVTLLQKMQAAAQAQFDLAGQGFLYLDAESTAPELLASYNLESTAGNVAERQICNNAGACQLLDAWLKPVASFRSVATLDPGFTGNTTDPFIPQLVGPAGDYAGSGLPAPWEDPGTYTNIANEKAGGANTANPIRYTVGRFLPNEDGLDEFNVPDYDYATRQHSDNLGDDRPGFDYPINDYYDRVLELYEAGIGVSSTGSGISSRSLARRQLSPLDWECYIALWFHEKVPGQQDFFTINLPLFDTIDTHCYGVE